MRRLIAAALGAVMLLGPVSTAIARPHVLWKSDSFRLAGALHGSRLRLIEENLTDLPLTYRCRLHTIDLQGDRRARSLRGRLDPRATATDTIRGQGALPVRARCSVVSDSDHDVLWSDNTFVVLGSEFTLSDGSPHLLLEFYNTSGNQARLNCSWWTKASSSPEIYPTIWSPNIGPNGRNGLSTGGTLAGLMNFDCKPYAAGAPVPVQLPVGLTSLFDSGTFMVTHQAYTGSDGGSRYFLRFINRLEQAVTASCSWTETWPDNTSHPMTWTQSLHGFGISGRSGGGSSPTPVAFTGMTCSTTAA